MPGEVMSYKMSKSWSKQAQRLLKGMMEAEETVSYGTVFTHFKGGRTKDSEWKGVDLNKTRRNVFPLPAPGGKPRPMPGMPWGRPAKEVRLAKSLSSLGCISDIPNNESWEA